MPYSQHGDTVDTENTENAGFFRCPRRLGGEINSHRLRPFNGELLTEPAATIAA